MRIEQCDRCEPSRIAHAADADTPVVLRHIFQEILDRVVGVRTFIDGFRIPLIARRTKHLKDTFRIFTAADVLKYENIPVGDELRLRSVEARRIPARNPIWRPLHVYWQTS